MRDSNCALCEEAEETLLHLFRGCHVTRAIDFASRWGVRLDGRNNDNIIEFIKGCLEVKSSPRRASMEERLLPVILSSLFYNVWSLRNLTFFEGKMCITGAVKGLEGMVDKYSLEGQKGEEQTMAENQINRGYWSPLAEGGLAVNTDAAWKDGSGAMAVVVRDSKKGFLLIATRLINARCSEEAKVRTINWASTMLESKNWEKLEWRCDAARVVDQIQHPGEALKWSTRNHILEIRNMFITNWWKIAKVTRESNCIADCAAKLTLLSK